MSLTNFTYLYQDNSARKTLVLLHGTGGDEHDLLSLVDHLHIEANILSLRGNVVENGMNRFFRRLSFGVFDEKNIREEGEKLRQFITSFVDSKNISQEDLVYLGYSNGANMIVALLLLHPEMVVTAILLHPMLPLSTEEGDFQHMNLALTYGENDTMIPPAETEELIKVLKERGARVETFAHSGGHEITKEELAFISHYYAGLEKNLNEKLNPF